eukprot:jgi/Chlat1/855/Chrsp104S01293
MAISLSLLELDACEYLGEADGFHLVEKLLEAKEKMHTAAAASDYAKAAAYKEITEGLVQLGLRAKKLKEDELASAEKTEYKQAAQLRDQRIKLWRQADTFLTAVERGLQDPERVRDLAEASSGDSDGENGAVMFFQKLADIATAASSKGKSATAGTTSSQQPSRRDLWLAAHPTDPTFVSKELPAALRSFARSAAEIRDLKEHISKAASLDKRRGYSTSVVDECNKCGQTYPLLHLNCPERAMVRHNGGTFAKEFSSGDPQHKATLRSASGSVSPEATPERLHSSSKPPLPTTKAATYEEGSLAKGLAFEKPRSQSFSTQKSHRTSVSSRQQQQRHVGAGLTNAEVAKLLRRLESGVGLAKAHRKRVTCQCDECVATDESREQSSSDSLMSNPRDSCDCSSCECDDDDDEDSDKKDGSWVVYHSKDGGAHAVSADSVVYVKFYF